MASSDAIIQRKRAALLAKIPPEWRIAADHLPTSLNVTSFPSTCGLLSPLELEITASSARTIIDNARQGRWKAVQICRAFCLRASIAQQLVNCLAEICFEEAMTRAQELDDYLETHGKTIGPLHGLPHSVKDSMQVKGLDSTIGFVHWAEQPHRSDETDVIATLRRAGAIIYCKTTAPTSMMMIETNSLLFGRTLNPLNRDLSPGGSSGGEGALIALRGSPLGVGTDIGGSIRIPAAFCGLWGLKPSSGRFPLLGGRSGMPGQEAVVATNGPGVLFLAHTLADLELYCKTIVDSSPWERDTRTIPLPWRAIASPLPSKLAFAVLYDDGVARPFPPILRALRETVAKLKKLGHVVIEWENTEHRLASELLHRLYTADGGRTIAGMIEQSDAPWPKGLAEYKEASEDPKRDLLTSEMWKLHLQRGGMVNRIVAQWNATAEKTGTGRPIDAIISPVSAMTACRHDTYKHWGYTGIWNIVDWTAGVFPVTHVDPALDPIDTSYQPYSELDRYIHEEYDPQAYAGAPVGLQLIGRRLQEEKMLDMLALFE